MMDSLFNRIEQYREKLFECQLKAVRFEHPEYSDEEVLLRALELRSFIIEAEENNVRMGSRVNEDKPKSNGNTKS